MNERITFQKSRASSDRYGNHITFWEDYFSCYTYANTYAALESGDEVIREERSITFEVRYCPETAKVSSTGYRILFRGDVYDIKSVDMMNYQNQMIRFTCRKK